MIEKRNETELSIIRATKQLLSEKGNVTVKEISEKAFVNIASINYYFGSKDNLINIVIKDVISDLQNEIVLEIMDGDMNTDDFEESMSSMFNIIFKFAAQNAGIINYSFLQMANQSKATNILVELFILDDKFIEMILNLLRKQLPDSSDETLFSKYIILFSSFVVPFFLSFSGWYKFFEMKDSGESFLEKHRDTYLIELKKILFT